jgi:hypothetical protein
MQVHTCLFQFPEKTYSIIPCVSEFIIFYNSFSIFQFNLNSVSVLPFFSALSHLHIQLTSF